MAGDLVEHGIRYAVNCPIELFPSLRAMKFTVIPFTEVLGLRADVFSLLQATASVTRFCPFIDVLRLSVQLLMGSWRKAGGGGKAQRGNDPGTILH